MHSLLQQVHPVPVWPSKTKLAQLGFSLLVQCLLHSCWVAPAGLSLPPHRMAPWAASSCMARQLSPCLRLQQHAQQLPSGSIVGAELCSYVANVQLSTKCLQSFDRQSIH